MKKGDLVLFTGEHSILVYGERYEVFSCNETDVQLVMETGFAGVPMSDVILVQIAE